MVSTLAGVCRSSFNRQGKARLSSVGREVIFGSGIYLHVWLAQTSRTLPMEVHLGVALGQQDPEA